MSSHRNVPPTHDNCASVVLCGAAEPPEGRDRVPVIGCAFMRTRGSPSVRVQNKANQFLGQITSPADNAFVEGDPGEEQARADGWRPLWEVEIIVVEDTRDAVTVDIQYRRLPGCDNDSAQTMMAVYRELGRAIVGRGGRRIVG